MVLKPEGEQAAVLVTALLVTHDGGVWLPQVISSLFAQSRPIDRIIAIDTESEDQSRAMLKNARIPTLSAKRGDGFGDALMIGLQSLPPAEPGVEEFLWILHDDFAPNRDALAHLLNGISKNPLIAATGPKLRSWYNQNHLLEVGVSIAGNGARWTGLESNELDQGQHDSVVDVLSVSTAGMLVRRSIFEELNGFDPNLSLFRDDVDFGWRARRLGYSLTVTPEAWGLHAEAGASERRTIDVDEGFLHRPLLLDRKNAAYVLFANAPWWAIPWITIQLFVTASFRAFINLLAKLPGYAGDELGAFALLLIRPAKLLKARKSRKSARLLPARVVVSYLPPLGEQLRLGIERFRDALTIFFHIPVANGAAQRDISHFESEIGGTKYDEDIHPEYPETPIFSNGVSNGVTENGEALTIGREFFRFAKSHPILWALAALLVIDIFYSHHRFGSIAGGALPQSPASSLDLIHRYFETWHSVGIGSALASPTWLLLLGITSFILFSAASFTVSLIWFLAPLLALVVTYRALGRMGATRAVATVGALIYALSPTTMAAINQGRLSTLALIILAPSLISLGPDSAAREKKTWRRIYALSLFAGLISAFSAMFLALWSIFFLSNTVLYLRKELDLSNQQKMPLLDKFNLIPISKRMLTLAVIPWLLNFPWSLELLIHPTRFFQDAGFPLAGGNRYSTLFFNPGGAHTVPLWIVSPFLYLFLVTLIKRSWRKGAAQAATALGVAIALSSLTIVGNGSVGDYFVGDLLVFAQIFLLFQIAPEVKEITAKLRNSSIGLRHLALSVGILLSLYSLTATLIWSVTGGANGLVKVKTSEVTPAFLTNLSQVSARPKLLAISASNGKITYYISRGNDISLGQPDVITSEPPALDLAISSLIDGANINSAKAISKFGISYIFLRSPIDQSISRAIDGLGGFTRTSSTKEGIIWKVAGAAPHAYLLSPNNVATLIPASEVSANGVISGSGTIYLSENYDRHWLALLNGAVLKPSETKDGLISFAVPATSNNKSELISIFHEGSSRRIAYSFQVLVFLFVIVMTLPAGRKKRARFAEVEVASVDGEK